MYNDFLSASPEGCFLRRHTHARPRGYKKPPTPWNKICLNICLAPGYTSFLPLKTHFFFSTKFSIRIIHVTLKFFFFRGVLLFKERSFCAGRCSFVIVSGVPPRCQLLPFFFFFFLIKNEAAFMRPRPQLKIVRV